MKKEDKGLIIEHIGETLKEYAHFYLVDVTGMNAEATSNLRRKCFGANIKMLLISALQSAGQTIHGVLKTMGERPE